MSLKNGNVLHMVALHEFSSGQIPDINPIDGRPECEFSPFRTGSFMLISHLEDAGGAFLQAFKGPFPGTSGAFDESAVLEVKLGGVVPAISKIDGEGGKYCGKKAGDWITAFWNGTVMFPPFAVRWCMIELPPADSPITVTLSVRF